MDDAVERMAALSSKVKLIGIPGPAEMRKIDSPVDKIFYPGWSLLDDDFNRAFIAQPAACGKRILDMNLKTITFIKHTGYAPLRIVGIRFTVLFFSDNGYRAESGSMYGKAQTRYAAAYYKKVAGWSVHVDIASMIGRKYTWNHMVNDPPALTPVCMVARKIA
jgi:hypothetical protein